MDDAPTVKGSTVILPPSEVLHIPGLGFDGLVGYSPIAMAKNAIGMAIACEEYGAKFFANCAQNIVFSKKNGDGYLFSKSVKGLPETEKTWALLDNDFTDVKDKKGRLLYRYKSCIDEFPYKVEHEGKEYTVIEKSLESRSA